MMMERSSNGVPAQVIHNLGFGYIHGAMHHANLFDAANGRVLWLAGDYVGSYKARRIAAVNDPDTAQGGTAKGFATLVDLAFRGAFGDRGFAASRMVASRRRNRSWIFREGVDAGYVDEAGKIGDGKRQDGVFIHCEVVKLTHSSLGRTFILAYHDAPGIAPVARGVFAALNDYLGV